MSEPWNSVRPGDRVKFDHTDETGIVHAIYPGNEDTVEVALDTGVFTCCDPPHVTVVQRDTGWMVPGGPRDPGPSR